MFIRRGMITCACYGTKRRSQKMKSIMNPLVIEKEKPEKAWAPKIRNQATLLHQKVKELRFSMLELTKEEIDLISTFLIHRIDTLTYYIANARSYKDNDVFDDLIKEKKTVLSLISKIHIHRKEATVIG